ncbi:MAG: hypothetical protein HY079_04090, partial [Elusimicrobia bacterium]|nr:hypothetical protein [Elusimicrobiota bacterium]
EPPADPSLRAVYGVVYDLFTGCAVERATVSLSLDSGPTGMYARTDRAGRYAIQIPRSLDGLLLSASAGGYRAGQLDESDPPYRERAAADRRLAAETATARDYEPVPLKFPNSADSVRQDLVVVPGR